MRAVSGQLCLERGAECWCMRAVSDQLCLERIIGLLLLELIPAGQVLIKQIQL